MLALSPSSHEIHIYAHRNGKFDKAWTLSEHDALVTGVDWAGSTNRIVTSAQDRNAYVWNMEDGEWKPTLVILRIQRAATCVQWCASEEKFAVGTGQKQVPVCYYEEENNWWVSKIIKKHNSTI